MFLSRTSEENPIRGEERVLSDSCCLIRDRIHTMLNLGHITRGPSESLCRPTCHWQNSPNRHSLQHAAAEAAQAIDAESLGGRFGSRIRKHRISSVHAGARQELEVFLANRLHLGRRRSNATEL